MKAAAAPQWRSSSKKIAHVVRLANGIEFVRRPARAAVARIPQEEPWDS